MSGDYNGMQTNPARARQLADRIAGINAQIQAASKGRKVSGKHRP